MYLRKSAISFFGFLQSSLLINDEPILHISKDVLLYFKRQATVQTVHNLPLSLSLSLALIQNI